MNAAISNCRAERPLDQSWKEEVEKDYESRKKKH